MGMVGQVQFLNYCGSGDLGVPKDTKAMGGPLALTLTLALMPALMLALTLALTLTLPKMASPGPTCSSIHLGALPATMAPTLR
jgi:hypothetical protein